MTLRSWCQMNHNGHSSLVKHNVEDKPKEICEKLKITSGKSTLFGHFFWWSIVRSTVFTSVFLLIHMILPLYYTHVWLCVDLKFALLMDIWWFRFGFRSCKGRRKKQDRQVGFKRRQIFFENQIFNHFYESHWHLKKMIFIT